ncbi:uncharacterized protein [Dermacentor albipictus]|uniref:uncharacterized protein n=1 Tax=Dermacentor albipictus TaxID=60249 RepID=UPI0031FCED34
MFSIEDFKKLHDSGGQWSCDLELVPPVTDNMIDSHFGESHRQLHKGWMFKEERYIRRIEYLMCGQPTGTELVLRSICLCSMKAGHYKQVVALAKGGAGAVVQAYCDCVAGQSQRCQHIAALLFAIRSIQRPSCTSVPCRWMAPTQGQNHLLTKPLVDITFKKHVINKTVPVKAKRQLPPHLRTAGQAGLLKFRSAIATHAPELVWNRYTERPAPVKNASPINDTEDMNSQKCLTLIDEYFKEQVSLTATERADICAKTVGQDKNPLWFAERTGKLTASKFRRILHCLKPEGLVKEILYPRKEIMKSGDPRLYGIQNEAKAVQKYLEFMQLYDKNIDVLETGLHIHELHSFIAASPDRLVRDGSEDGLLEVKCPASKAGQRVVDACADKGFYLAVTNGEVTLKKDHYYYYQVQGQMGVAKKPWCDFVVFTDHADLQDCISVERIYFDAEIWKDILQGLVYFYKAAIIPELMTRRIRRLGFLYTTGAGYVSFKKYAVGFYLVDHCDEDHLKMTIRRLTRT